MGLANQPTSTSLDDGLELVGTRIVAAVRCAPPENKPTPTERDTCAPWLDAELALVRPTLRVVVALGSFAWSAAWRCWAAAGARCRGRGHGSGTVLRSTVGGVTLLGSYHPSQQNTFTGTLTRPMLDAVLRAAAELAR